MGQILPPVDAARGRVEQAIQSLGRGFAVARAGPDAWTLRKGSAELTVRIAAADAGNKYGMLQVTSRVMRLPARPGAAERLLALNAEMGGLAAFQVRGGEVRLAAARTLEGLGEQEIERLVAQVGYFSDFYDDLLLREYGREHALRPPPPAPASSGPPGSGQPGSGAR